MIVDERFKDASPVATVERIQKILQENGLETEEIWSKNDISHCFALHLVIKGTFFSTNGKGVTRELARASAYAEMMERLQTGLLGLGGRIVYGDSQWLDREQVKQAGDVLYESVSGIIRDFDNMEFSPDQLIQCAFDYANGGDKVRCVPFYSVLDDKMVSIPSALMVPLYSSTGMAAGNTPEEAIVQGMSEIWERWCQRHFLVKDMVPPTIPDSYLQNYPMAYETITQVRNSGYEVLVKDCSMGTGWPAIATAVIDKRTHTYHVHMGASPVFEIALGRSLTETFQGRLLEKVTDTDLSESAKNTRTYRRSYVMGRGAYPIEYFNGEPSFPFVPFEDRTHCSNRELLAYAVEFFRSRGMKIYVRNMSHMGFCTYQVIVPQMNHSHFELLTSSLNIPRLYGEITGIWHNLRDATPDQLFSMQLLNYYKVNNVLIDGKPRCSGLLMLPVSGDPVEDIAIGSAHIGYTDWACGNPAAAYSIAQQIAQMKVQGLSDYCSCLCRTKKMIDAGQTLAEALDKLSLFYEQAEIEMVRAVLEEERNPFDHLIVHCGAEYGENCHACRYRHSCTMVRELQIGQLVQKYVDAFDCEKAVADLKNLFAGM